MFRKRYPAVEAQSSVQVSDTSNTSSNSSKTNDNHDEMMINGLIYSMPQSLSIRVSKAHQKNFSQRNQYSISNNSQETVIFDLNSGNSYINCFESYLKFKLKIDSFTDVIGGVSGQRGFTFGSNSAMAMFNSTKFRSRSGTELTRTEQAGLVSKVEIQYKKSKNWIDTIGASMLYNVASSPVSATQETVTVTIPLCELDSFFNPLKKQDLCPQLASGGRLELSLENLNHCIVNTETANTTINSISMFDIELSLSCSQLSDEGQKVLNAEAAASGLEWTYSRFYTVENVLQNGQTSANIQVHKAVSQASRAWAIIQDTGNDNSQALDAFKSAPYDYKSVQWRLGSLYMPFQPVNDFIQTSNSRNGIESYFLTYNSYDKIRNPDTDKNVTPSQFSTDSAIIGVQLSKDSNMLISGSAINNSRVLEALIELNPQNNRKITIVLEYTSVAKAFIDNVSVAL
jgi:hypothetical protein